MRILIIGNGGREHALAWAVARSEHQPEIFIAPGNAGTALTGKNVSIAPTDTEGLLYFAQEQRIDLTIVGPEAPLVAGIVDAFSSAGLPVIGPTAAAARLEGSKTFAKDFMQRHQIPTAAYRTFSADEFGEAESFILETGAPVVLKADGLAAGKGVLICTSEGAAIAGLRRILRDRQFGQAGERVVIEEFLEGEEASIFAVTDGQDYLLLAPAQDHKRIGEGDTGPNTGGMGAYAPAPVVTAELMERIRKEVVEPTLRGMAAEGHPYSGFLYCGLMMTQEGPKVIEYNCRLGDPEAQVVLPLIDFDFVDMLLYLSSGALGQVSLPPASQHAACVVLASGGYPAEYEKGFRIGGLEQASTEALVFHAGTREDGGDIFTDGGRVLAVTGTGQSLAEALQRAYHAAGMIHFEGKQFRRDIGAKGLKHS